MTEMIRKELLDFAGGPVVNGPPANAGHTDLTPGSGRSHAPQLLSLCSRVCALQLEKALLHQQRPNAAKNK